MIKLLCPECNSEDIAYRATINDEQIFTCNVCDCFYPLNKMEWVECIRD